MDANFSHLRDHSNALEQKQDTLLNPDGTLKPGAVNNSNILADGVVTAAKLAAGAVFSTGMVIASFDGTTPFDPTAIPAPPWLELNGQAVSRTTFAALFAMLSTTYGVGDGSTTFNLPTLVRRTLVGRGGAGSSFLGNVIGNAGGEESHTLTQNEMPAHVHTVQTYAGVETSGGHVDAGVTGAGSGSQTGITGTNTPHNNIQPSMVIRYLIKT